ncbi:MAG: hypothetical protein WCE94_10380 [Candidatus Methanoperedens sp.]
MGIWAWVQPVDRIWKVVTDAEKGMLCVYDEKSQLIQERKGLTREEVNFIEQNFLGVVATCLTCEETAAPPVVDIVKPEPEFNYMYA